MRSLVFLAILAVSQGVFAQGTYVQPYIRSDGTYVDGHYRSRPNGSTVDNYSTLGNVNPYTGKEGTRPPHSSSGLRSIQRLNDRMNER